MEAKLLRTVVTVEAAAVGALLLFLSPRRASATDDGCCSNQVCVTTDREDGCTKSIGEFCNSTDKGTCYDQICTGTNDPGCAEE